MGVYAVIYAGAVVFLAGCILRVFEYAKAPVHLRWELYPVPHGESRGAAHRARGDHAGELRVMAPEILFLQGLRQFNRPLWIRSFPFHFGLYLLIASATLVVGCALASFWVPGWPADSLTGHAAHALYTAAGVLGAVLVIVGSAGLLLRRLRDPELRDYTASADLFNLLAFAVTFAVLLWGYLDRGPGFPGAVVMARGLLTLRAPASVPPPLAVGLVLLAALIAYIPYTHMAHFIAKYFTYHAVRWDDALKLPGGKLERQMAEYLTYRPTWSAPHIGADGATPWADIATRAPRRPEERPR